MRKSKALVDHLASEQELKEQCATVCRDLVELWSSITGSDINVTTISGGISNALFKVESIGNISVEPNAIVLRVYGDNTEKFVNREEEVEMMQTLHKEGFGPKVLGTFENGRIESFLELRCLEPDEIGQPEFQGAIARTLAKFHGLSRDWKKPTSPLAPFAVTKDWLETAKKLDFSDDEKKMEAFSRMDVDGIVAEVEEMEKFAACVDSPVVFSHNDLLSGNIMVSKTYNGVDDIGMTFIDFEYAEWAPRGFDLGNHFCEYAGFDADYSKYPVDGSQFVKSYLEAWHSEEEIDQSAVNRVTKEANFFALAAHLHWVAWALLQAKWSSIDFDYMAYASLRLDEYKKRKYVFINEFKQALDMT